MADRDLPDRVRTVIIGAGIVGCATAYYLAEFGEEDVAVVDQGAIPETGGSTLHAPGGVGQGGMNETLVRFAKQSRDLYRSMDAYRERGGLDVAFDESEMAFMQLLVEHADAWDVEAELLSPAEVGELNPHLDVSKIVGALSTPTMGSTRTVALLDRLRERAKRAGISFHEHTKVTDIEVRNGAVSEVVAGRGRITTERVLVAANIWSPLLGEMVGVDIPLVPCEHQFAVTEPLAELSEDLDRQWEGGIRSRRGRIYAGPMGSGYGVGSYDHAPRVVDPTSLDDPQSAMEHPPVNEYYVGDESRQPPSMPMPASREFTPEDFASGWEHAVELFPMLEGAEIEEAFNGMFSFTPDGMPILGPARSVEGFWVAAAVWITHAGGAGRAIAEWIVDGHPTIDVSGCHIERFRAHERSPKYVREMGARSYRNVHEIDPMHPRSPLEAPRGIRRSPFHRRQRGLDATFTASAGLERVRSYGVNERLLDRYEGRIPNRSGWNARHWSRIEGAEHLALRDGVGLYDVTGLSHIEIDGPGSESFVQSLFSADMDLGVGQLRYTPMLSERGTILGDMTVVRSEETGYLVLANGGIGGPQQLAWMCANRPGDGSVRIRDRMADYCGLGVWGPEARSVLEPLLDVSLSDSAFPYLSARSCYAGEVPVLALRVSYVGERGWELHTDMQHGGKLWDLVWEAGRDHDMVPIGDGALNSLRLEKGYRLWNADINNAVDPFEGGLEFTVDLDAGGFIGAEALKQRRRGDRERTLATLALDEPGASVFPGMPILQGSRPVGYVTSADYGYSIGRGLALGYLPPHLAEAGTELAIRFEGQTHPATVTGDTPFDPEGERL